MLKVHQDIILSNLPFLVEQTDLNTLVPELVKKDVLNKRMISRILGTSDSIKRQKTNLYLEILKRGPQAFAKLEEALASSNHLYLAQKLREMDAGQSSLIRPNNSLNSKSSSPRYGNNECESDGPFLSSQKMVSGSNARAERPEAFPQDFPPTTSGLRSWGNYKNSPNKTSDISDFQKNLSDPNGKVFAAPTYGFESLDENLRKLGVLSEDDVLIYTSKKNEPVHVKCATDWQVEDVGKPRIYKMDSYPRGWALIVNNKKFLNSSEYPERKGSGNDVRRLQHLLMQLHFEVEIHKNKTKSEMEEIVKKFSQKPELNDVDCIWVTFMSHGEEGETPENGEIVGVDGIGYKTEEIVARFFNDACRALIHKPKLFFFQACRGCLIDPGVEVGKLMNLSHRIVTDGKRVRLPQQKVKVRTQSDIFVAYPAPSGYMANRDLYTGAWFIQAVIDIFSKFAYNTHLDDLLKMVDERIKGMNNLLPPNFQAVTIKSIGWNKHLYFNPGLCKDKVTGATVRIGNPVIASQSDEGMDVVDVSSTNSDKSPNGVTYSRMKSHGDEDEDAKNEHIKYSKTRRTDVKMPIFWMAHRNFTSARKHLRCAEKPRPFLGLTK